MTRATDSSRCAGATPGGLLAAALAAILSCWAGPTSARSLEAVRSSGALALCAHPNSLPFANKGGGPPGFQIELGRALAEQIGVTLRPEWIVVQSQIYRTTCDIVLDTIDDAEAQSDSGLSVSRPYYRTGIALAVPRGSAVTSFATLDGHTKVGVLVGSVAAMVLGQRHVPISIFGFEDDMLDALAKHEIGAAAVTPLTAGYYRMTHPEAQITILPPDEAERALVWNVGVGLRRPDAKLRQAIDAALERLGGDGTIKAIYARYGVELEQPR